MSASYFTIVHILVLFIIFSLFVLFVVLSFKTDKKLFWSLLFTNFAVCSILGVFMMPVIDKYTKKGVLENVTNQRVLRNETIVFTGQVRNVGKFKLSGCDFTVKLINDPVSKDSLTGENVFKSTGVSFFAKIFGQSDSSNEKPNTVEFSFRVAKNLDVKKSASFNVSMPYPPYFSKTMIINKLDCY